MTSNDKGGTPYYEAKDKWDDDLIGIDDKELAIADLETFGNLYTYEQALALAPEGWRLPTDEDLSLIHISIITFLGLFCGITEL